jgi:phospholipid/cholesterol/gamma-HCH transport system substrate-binding protein
MKESTRNIAIGLTVIVALGMVCGMILIFAGLPGPLHGGYRIKLHFTGAANAHEGDQVHLNGMPIGKIADIYFTDGDARKGVTFVARIDRGARIPGNVRAYIVSKGLAGGAYLDLRSDGPERIDPATGKPLAFLPKDFDQPIEGTIRTGLPIPDELTDAMTGVSELAKNLNALVGKQDDLTPSPDTLPSLFTAVGTLNRVLSGIERVFGNVKTEKNMEAIMANLAEATAQATKAMEAFEAFATEAKETAQEAKRTFQSATTTVAATKKRIEQLAEKLVEDAEKVSQVLTSVNKLVMKVESGKGSAGRLLNDPKLYNNLLEATRQIGELVKELRDLVKLWKQRGVGIKLK